MFALGKGGGIRGIVAHTESSSSLCYSKHATDLPVCAICIYKLSTDGCNQLAIINGDSMNVHVSTVIGELPKTCDMVKRSHLLPCVSINKYEEGTSIAGTFHHIIFRKQQTTLYPNTKPISKIMLHSEPGMNTG